MSSGLEMAGRSSRSRHAWREQVAIAMLAVLSALALLLAWRRMAGALDRPLDALTLAVLALIFSATACTARRLEFAARDFRWNLWPASALGVLGVALSIPGTPALGLVALWAILIAEETYAWWPRASVDAPPAASPTPTETATPRPTSARPPASELDDVDEACEESLADDVVQQFTRRQLPDGTELVEGWLRVDLAARQANASAHLGFCPPLARPPELTCEQIGGPSARIKLPQVLAHGARLDLKLARAADTPQTIVLHFSARCRA